MFRHLFITIGIILLVTNNSVLSKNVTSKPTITWLMIHYPPYYISSESSKDLGVHNRVVDYFKKSLQGYEHRSIMVNVPRLFNTLSKEHDVTYCSPGLGGKPVDQNVKYSDPMFNSPSPGLVVRRDGPFKKLSKISLREAVGTMGIQIGKPDEGTYGPKLEEVFKEYPTKFVNFNSSEPRVGNSMVVRKRVHGFLAYSLAFKYFQNQMEDGDQLKFLPITENFKYTPTHAICTDSKRGKEVISKINSLLKEQEYKEVVREVFIDLIPKNLKNEFFKANKF